MDIGSFLTENLDLIVIVGIVGIVLAVFRPVILEAVRGARENVPPGALNEIIKGVTPILYDAVDSRLRDLEDAARADTRTPLDEAVMSELRDAVRELKDIVVGAQAAKEQ